MKLLQTKHGANSSSGDRLFLTSAPATVGCRVACAPRARNRRRPRVGRERYRSPACTPRTKHASAYWPAFASVTCELGCLSPTRASGGRTTAASSKQNNKSRRRGEFRKNNIEVFFYLYIYIIHIILLNLYSSQKKSARTLRKWSNT